MEWSNWTRFTRIAQRILDSRLMCDSVTFSGSYSGRSFHDICLHPTYKLIWSVYSIRRCAIIGHKVFLINKDLRNSPRTRIYSCVHERTVVLVFCLYSFFILLSVFLSFKIQKHTVGIQIKLLIPCGSPKNQTEVLQDIFNQRFGG